jgi:deazaflavin-dependent oxidoreductase (nitroreductase family)
MNDNATDHATDAKVIEQFRAGGEIEGMHRDRLVLLTTVGAKTGQHRTTPMMHVPTEGGILVIASANAAPDDPQWFHNLVADPRVHVEESDTEYDAQATVLAGARRAAEWKALVAAYPFFEKHQAKVDREIPLVELARV